MKKLLLLPALFIVMTAQAQTKQYIKVETSHFDKDRNIKSKTIKYSGGTIDVEANSITIDKEAPKPLYYTIVSKGKIEPQDELYTSQEYICITTLKTGSLKALKLVLFFTPSKQLCDVIVKEGNKNTDYCITDK